MKVLIYAKIPPELYDILELFVESDGFMKLVDAHDKFTVVYDVEAKYLIAGVRFANIDLSVYRGKPIKEIDITPSERKIDLLLKVLKELGEPDQIKTKERRSVLISKKVGKKVVVR